MSDPNYRARLRAALHAQDHCALFEIAYEILGALEYAERPRAKPKNTKQTWMTPFAEAWEKEMGEGSFPYGPSARPLRALLEKNPEAEVARRLGYYVRVAKKSGEARFMSVSRFAQTFNEWSPDAPAFED